MYCVVALFTLRISINRTASQSSLTNKSQQIAKYQQEQLYETPQSLRKRLLFSQKHISLFIEDQEII